MHNYIFILKSYEVERFGVIFDLLKVQVSLSLTRDVGGKLRRLGVRAEMCMTPLISILVSLSWKNSCNPAATLIPWFKYFFSNQT